MSRNVAQTRDLPSELRDGLAGTIAAVKPVVCADVVPNAK